MSNSSNFHPSHIFQKVLNEKKPKLDPQSLKSVIKLARKLTRLTLPSNCAQNLKAEFQDPEKALEYSKRKNMIFNQYIKTEFKKLNCHKNPVKRPKKSKSFTPSPVQLSFKHQNTLENSLSPQKPVKNQSFASTRPYQRKLSQIDSFLQPYLKEEKIILPPLIKSVPIHQDPALSFAKKNSAEFEANLSKLKNDRMEFLQTVNEKCENFLPECREDIQNIEKIHAFKVEERNRVGEYLEDFSDCLKIASDQKNFQESLDNRCYNRRLDEEFINELDELKLKLMEVSKKAIDLGGKKIWRLKNTLFIAKTNRIINSVPTFRK